jgi:hypothetical protein
VTIALPTTEPGSAAAAGVLKARTGYPGGVTDGEPPQTPAEDLPQDPGTSGLPSREEQPPRSPERPDGEDEETGSDAARRMPRHRADE